MTEHEKRGDGEIVDIVFSGPPGTSIKFGEWVQREDWYWVLRLSRRPAPEPPAASEDDDLPQVAGRLERTLDEFDRAARSCMREEQEKPAPDNRLIGVLCDAVRLARESAAPEIRAPAPAAGEDEEDSPSVVPFPPLCGDCGSRHYASAPCRELDEYANAVYHAMSAHPDEEHCTCVPILRAEVARLRDENERLGSLICDECNDPDGSPTHYTENRAEGRVPCICVTETGPYQELLAERDRLREQLDPESIRPHRRRARGGRGRSCVR